MTAFGDHDAFVLKLDSTGVYKWAIKVTGMGHQYAGAVITDPYENVYLVGSFEGLTDFNPTTAIYNVPSSGLNDAFILKLNQFGGIVWVKTFQGTGEQKGYAIVSDATGNLYTTGFCSDSTDFDPDTGTFWLNGTSNAFIACLDSSGYLKWSELFTGNQELAGQGLSIYYGMYIYSVGYFSGQADFDPASGTSYLFTAGLNDAYILKLKPSTISAINEQFNTKTSFFPNPTTGQVNLTYLLPQNQSGLMEIYDITGNEMFVQTLSPRSSIQYLDLTFLENGVYTISIKSGAVVSLSKIVIMK